jgi:hypothetical protein
VGQIQPSCQRSGDQVGLIVTPLALAVPVKRHRHDDVRLQTLGMNYFGQPLREPCPERLHPFEFQKEYRAYQRPIIRGEASRTIECINPFLICWLLPANLAAILPGVMQSC